MRHKKIHSKEDAKTEKDRLNFALACLKISWEEARKGLGNISAASLAFYLQNESEVEIPEFRLDLLLIKYGVSKIYVRTGVGDPEATSEERLSQLGQEMKLISPIIDNLRVKNIALSILNFNNKELKNIETLIKDTIQSRTKEKEKSHK